MKKIILGLVVLFSFQLCTSELSEIDGVVGDYIDSNPIDTNGDNNIISIPSESFLSQYFSTEILTPISTRIENQIRHDFNSPVTSETISKELSAKWTGDFYFEAGEYVFSVRSNKGIKVSIDDKVVLNEIENQKPSTYKVNYQMDGVHRLVVEYNIEENNSNDNIDATNNETNVSGETSNDEGSSNSSGVTIVDDKSIETTDNGVTIASGDSTDTQSDDEAIATTITDNDNNPIVEVDNDTPTIEVNWKPVGENSVLFFDGFENGLDTPPWRQLGQGIVETVSSPTVSGSGALRMYIERKLYSSSGNARCQLQYNGGTDFDVPKYQPHFSSWGIRFALYVPSDFIPDPTSEIIFQLKGYADEYDTYTQNPPFHLSILSNNFEVVVRTIAADPGSNDDKNGSSFKNIAKVSPGHWHYFIIDTHWDYKVNGNGYHRVYMKIDSPPSVNDVMVNYSGGTGYNDFYNTYAIFNIYKYNWSNQSKVNQSIAAGVSHREYIFDDIEIRDSNYFSP